MCNVMKVYTHYKYIERAQEIYASLSLISVELPSGVALAWPPLFLVLSSSCSRHCVEMRGFDR